MAALTVELPTAVPLVGAMACRLAERSSIRALLIKGAPAAAAGVRSDRPSVDVDLWVEPGRFEDYLGGLEARGWARYAASPASPVGVGWGHAVTMTHRDWPCTIDVHRRFPGLLSDDSGVFEVVWRAHSTTWVGRQEVAVPSRVTAAAITVLHATRSGDSHTRGDRECALAAARAFSLEEREELSRLATLTGSAEPLADLLEAAGCPVPESSGSPERLQEWRLQLEVRSRPGGPWLLALRRASWPQRARLLAWAVRPTQQDYANAGGRPGRAGSVRAVAHRCRRGLAALPDAWRAVRKA